MDDRVVFIGLRRRSDDAAVRRASLASDTSAPFRITQPTQRDMPTSRQCAPTLWPAAQDGVNPSDAISKTHSRKSGVFYWTILEWHTASRSPPTLVANGTMRATLALGRSIARRHQCRHRRVVVVAHGASPLW